MNKGSKVAIVCCSNGQLQTYKEKINRLKNILEDVGLIPVFSDFIYEKESVFSGIGIERASALMDFYKDKEIKAIFDISGGDIANEILPYLDFQVIAESNKQFWGYSDLTTIINAIFTKTGKSSVLYQIRNFLYSNSQKQISSFCNSIFHGKNDLFSFEYKFIQGKILDGIVIGGNIRCLLKLAGTKYWPDMQDKILLLEGLGGTIPQMTTYLCQLKQLGVFEMIRGILLGTFIKMEEENCIPTMEELVKRYASEVPCIVKTNEIGHGNDSKGIIIGERITLT